VCLISVDGRSITLNVEKDVDSVETIAQDERMYVEKLLNFALTGWGHYNMVLNAVSVRTFPCFLYSLSVAFIPSLALLHAISLSLSPSLSLCLSSSLSPIALHVPVSFPPPPPPLPPPPPPPPRPPPPPPLSSPS